MLRQAITPRLDIPRDALVLEIGSGHRPHPRADVLTDKYLNDVERGGRLVTDRPFLQVDAEQLPFKPRVFDYIICRHVLEHLEDPENFFQEISRVGRSGYIEAPSIVWEHLHPTRTYHRWYVMKIDNTLVLKRKPPRATHTFFGHLFERLNRYSSEYRLFIRRYADLFYVRYQWQDNVQYCITPPDGDRQSWFSNPWDETQLRHYVPPRGRLKQGIELILGAFESVGGSLLRKLYGLRHTPHRRSIDLAEIMQCPVCSHQTIEIAVGEARCQTCGWRTVAVFPN
jgi:SAM-dependent methyltransferase